MPPPTMPTFIPIKLKTFTYKSFLMNYKLLLIVPLIVLALALTYLFWTIETTGLNLDIDLKGGTQLIVESSDALDERELETVLDDYDANIRIASGLTGYSAFIEFDSSFNPQDVLDTLTDSGYIFDE